MTNVSPAARKPRRALGVACYAPIAFLLMLGFAGLAGLLINFKSYGVPSGSNIPALLVGDTVVVSKWPYGFSRYSFPIDLGFKGRILAGRPDRGDIAAFALPRDLGTTYIERVIGLPGDTIQMKQGRLYINGTMIPRTPIAKVQTEDFDGRDTEVPTFEERLPNGVSHAIVELQGDTGVNDNTKLFNVPPDSYFVMGDNRDNSDDSRASADNGGIGYVPFENLIGRAEFISFSVSKGRPPTVRWDRLFKPIH